MRWRRWIERFEENTELTPMLRNRVRGSGIGSAFLGRRVELNDGEVFNRKKETRKKKEKDSITRHVGSHRQSSCKGALFNGLKWRQQLQQ